MKGLQSGQVIGAYRLVRQLGTGGMGTVWEARQTVIGRRAAIKVLHAEYSSQPQNAFRFLTEARAVNIVQHPGLVDIYELGHLDDGTPYIVMEFLDGEPLAARIDRGACPPPDAIRIARQIASAVAAAHAKGIIHRDLKPENVMLVRDLETHAGERVKVLDFGIAKILHDDVAPERDKRTRTGMVMGTPRYMAPEQCRGTGIYDARVDVYALGILLFEMIAGRPPFLAEGLGELMYEHMAVSPPALNELQPATPLELTTLVNAMLAKSAADRPWMNQVAAALELLGAPKAVGAGTVELSGMAPPLLPPRNRTPSGAPAPTVSAGPRARLPSRTHSTLGQAAGERIGTSERLGSAASSRKRTVLAATTLGLVVLGCVAVGVLRHSAVPSTPVAQPASEVPPPVLASLMPAPAPPPPRRVRWSITTTPQGATVRSLDGDILGRTPFSLIQPAQDGELTVALSLPGYLVRQVLLSRNRDEDIDERLDPVTRSRAVRGLRSSHDPDPRGGRDEDVVVH